MKRVKGSLGKLEIVTSKGEGGKAAPATANGAFSQRWVLKAAKFDN